VTVRKPGRIEANECLSVERPAHQVDEDLELARQIEGQRLQTFAHTSPWSDSASWPARLRTLDVARLLRRRSGSNDRGGWGKPRRTLRVLPAPLAASHPRRGRT
jgi:hypothetical protein